MSYTVAKAESAERMAAAIMQPSRVSGVRAPTFPGLQPTATTRAVGEGEIKTAAAETAGVLCRSPLYPLWLERVDTTKWMYYSTYKSDTTYGAGTPIQPLTMNIVDLDNSYASLTAADTSNVGTTGFAANPYTSAFPRPCAIMALEGDDKIPYTYVPKGARCYVFGWGTTTVTGTIGSPTDISLQYRIRAGDDDDLVATSLSTTANSNSFGYLITAAASFWIRPTAASISVIGGLASYPGPGEYRFAVFVTNVAITSTDITYSTIAGVGPFVNGTAVSILASPLLMPVPEAVGAGTYAFTSSAYVSTLPTGTDLSLENTTKIMNKEGTIVAGVVDHADRDPWEVASATAVSTIANLPKERRYRRAAEHGARLFVPPGSDSFNSFRNFTIRGQATGLLNYPCLALARGDKAVIFVIMDADVATVSSFTFSLATTWEYRTMTQLVTAQICGTPLDALRQALIRCAVAPFCRSLERGSVLAVTQPKTRPVTPRPQRATKGKEKKAPNKAGQKKNGAQKPPKKAKAKAEMRGAKAVTYSY